MQIVSSSFDILLQMNGRDLPFMPPKRGSLFIVPNGIRPVMQRTAVEVGWANALDQEEFLWIVLFGSDDSNIRALEILSRLQTFSKMDKKNLAI